MLRPITRSANGAPSHRPLPVALLIGILAQTLFTWRVTVPHQLVFDEVHYVVAARVLRSLAYPVNIEHPLLGKLLIAMGMQLFGDDAFGWRFFSTLAGTAVVTGVFAILWLGTWRLRPAIVGAVLTILNFTVFIQARIAMLDGFMAAFVVLGAACLLWSMRGTYSEAWRRWIGAAVLLGLAVAVKWTAAPYVAFAGVAFLLLRRGQPERWPGMRAIPALAALGGVSIATYFLTFTPAFFYENDPMTLARLIPFQLDMFHQQTQVLPPHTYQSNWWTWPFDLRPIWYLYEPADGAQRGILMLGNPAVIWGGLIAVAVCAWRWIRTRDAACGTAALLWAASIAMWAVIPKSLGFFYYYYLSTIWLPIVIAVALDRFGRRTRYWDEAFLLLGAVLFLHFYPIIAATALPDAQAFNRWMWLDSWR